MISAPDVSNTNAQPPIPEQIGSPTVSEILNQPEWTDDPTDPRYDASGQALWALALGFARKFSGSKEEKIHGHSKEDLAMLGALHVLIQAKRGKLNKVPVAERWNVIARILWNRMIDEARRFSNTHELQPPTMTDENGDTLGSDEALEIVAADKESAFRAGCPVRRKDLQRLGAMLDAAFENLPRSVEGLIKLRFGLYRSDEFDGSDHAPEYADPASMQDLIDFGYGQDRFAVRRRLDAGLKELKDRLLAELEKRRIVNFSV